MPFPSSDVNLTNLDLGTDSPATARTDLYDLATKFNLLRNFIGTIGQAVISAATKAAARSAMDAAVIGNNGDITGLTALASINGGPLAGFRNRIMNGDMRIDQRNAGNAVTPSVGGPTYTLDRWCLTQQLASTYTIQQVVDAPAGFYNSLKATVAVQRTPGAGDYYLLSNRIEAGNINDFQSGTATAATITVSLWVKGSVAGTYACALTNYNATRCYIGTITVGTTWAKQSITLGLDTGGTWLTAPTSAGLCLNIDLGSGTGGNTASPNQWLGASSIIRTAACVTLVNQTAGASLNITGVQLEVGSVSTPFEQRPYGLELALCQRYYYKSYNMSAAPGSASNPGVLYTVSGSGSGFYCYTSFPVSMRTTPTITTYNPSTGTSGQWNSSGGSIAASASIPGETGAAINGSTVSAGQFAWGHIVASAEL